MSAQYPVAVLVGSLRAQSVTRRIAQALIDRAPDSLSCSIVEIGDLPHYNEDSEADCPAGWTRFRGEIAAARAVLFVSPEYNRSVPGALKNAIDVGSRPFGRGALGRMPAAVLTHSPGPLGGFGANHALRQSLVFLDMPAMQQPESYIPHSKTLFDDDGRLVKEDTAAFLANFMTAYARWVTRLAVA